VLRADNGLNLRLLSHALRVAQIRGFERPKSARTERLANIGAAHRRKADTLVAIEDFGPSGPRLARWVTGRLAMAGEGFEPSKHEARGLQPRPFDRSGTPPGLRQA
jgi:hypothetical protein